MNAGTVVNGTLIVSSDDSRLKNTDIRTAISAMRSSLKTGIHGEGLELYELGDERKLEWPDGVVQIRQKFRLVLTKKLTQNQIYTVVNGVQAQPLTFSKYGG